MPNKSTVEPLSNDKNLRAQLSKVRSEIAKLNELVATAKRYSSKVYSYWGQYKRSETRLISANTRIAAQRKKLSKSAIDLSDILMQEKFKGVSKGFSQSHPLDNLGSRQE